MRVIACKGAGGPEVLELHSDAPVPSVNEDEVLIKVHAAGINRPDLMQREGKYPPPKNASPILGLEVAGEIVGIGSRVSWFNLGDRVCALTNGGGYAEYVAVPAGQCLPLYNTLSFVEAAAIPETLFTVWSNLVHRAKLRAGESLLIHGGSSGIGTMAIQIARYLGAKVAVTVGSEEKGRLCHSLGAELVIPYREQDYVLRCKEVFGGMDVVLDMVGGSYIQKNILVAAEEGRIVNIAYQQGAKVDVDFIRVMMKRLTLTGSTLRARSGEYKERIRNELQDKVWSEILERKIKPIVYRAYEFKEVAEAHRQLDSGSAYGKLVLTWDSV